ncbi:unnamed protein product [Adineta steineri]|uniref:N-acetyltransferase domain-containing protein n=1 Tax=Adineta steineri TaxID=433720 RepID=A0A819U5S2_9BILA|nr:unnamed protein product [Adineta steineri]CAF4083870.1 unnamed protein product [Adineta steineri]
MTSNFIIRRATIEDAPQLSLLGRKTFYETYTNELSIDLDSQRIEEYVEREHSVQAYCETINDPLQGVWIVFNENGNKEEPIAYAVATRFNLLPDYSSDPNDFGIKRIYIQRDYQGKQIGWKLMTEIIIWFRTVNPQPNRILLREHSKNLKAIRFYEKYGFKQPDEQSLRLGERIYNIFSFDLSHRAEQ